MKRYELNENEITNVNGGKDNPAPFAWITNPFADEETDNRLEEELHKYDGGELKPEHFIFKPDFEI